MKANADKYHLLVNSKEKVCTKIGPYNIESSEQQKLLGVLINNKLIFDKHINNFCAKNGMRYVECHKTFRNTNKKRLVMKACYCPLIR